MPKTDHSAELKVWRKAVKTLKAGEQVQVGETMLFPGLQEGQMELDLLSAERMVELCERRVKNAKLKAGKIEITVDDVDCGCKVDGKA
jgi:hypothetical protein